MSHYRLLWISLTVLLLIGGLVWYRLSPKEIEVIVARWNGARLKRLSPIPGPGP